MSIVFDLKVKNIITDDVEFETRDEMIDYLRSYKVDVMFGDSQVGEMSPLIDLSDKELEKYYVENKNG